MALITIFETQNVTGFSLNSAYGAFNKSVSPMPFQLVDGEEYVIFWDSDSYTRTAFSFTGADGSTCVAVGNKMVSTGENNGDPFAIVCDYTNNYLHYFSTEDKAEHEVGVHISDGGTMVLKDRTGADLPGIESVVELRVPTSGGKFQSFIGGVRTNKILHSNEVDFSTGDIVITPRKGEVFGTVTVPKPPALLPENILEGVTIAGVDGTAKDGGDIQILTKPIRFYNAYGDVLFSFSRKEIKEMTELPEGPALGNLVFDKWDYTLEELQSIMYFCDVSPQYKNSAGQAVAVVIVEIADPSESLVISYNNTATGDIYADWGDGSTSSGKFSGSTTSSAKLTHTYLESGTYVISFYTATQNTTIGTGLKGSYYWPLSSETGIGTTVMNNGKGATPQKRIISALGNYDSKVTVYFCGCENNLRFVSGLYWYNSANCTFLNCGSLKAIGRLLYLYRNELYGKYKFSGCASLERAQVSQTSEHMFDYCTNLKEVEFIGTGALACNEMNVKFSMLMTKTTPPTISATAPVWGTKPIYVPDEAVDAYKTASGWSDAAAYIYPASEYPDK